MYWQALLDEVNTAEGVDSVTYDDWVKVTANAGKDAMITAVGKLCTQLLKKVESKEQWTNLPATAQGGSVRDMKHSVCHIMSMTLRLDLNAAAKGGWKALEGSVYDNDAFSRAETILKTRFAAEKAACGTEARQRSDNELFDHEQIALIESILGGLVAGQQRARGVSDRAVRKPIDTLSLGVVNLLHFALGQRGVNLDHCLWGYLRMSRFNDGEVWDRVKPSKLIVKSDAKMSAVGAAKHKAGVLHHRDPMRCPVAMLGLYFAYIFLHESKTELPSFDDWLGSMHSRHLVRNQEGVQKDVTKFNEKLKEELSAIGAQHLDFTFHNWRAQRAKQAAEKMLPNQSIKQGGGWTSGCFENNYDGCNQTDYMLAGAGYDGTDPEVQAAHDRIFYKYMWSGGDAGVFGGDGGALVDALYRAHRPEMLELEKRARDLAASERTLPPSAPRPGESVLDFLHVVRHCILVWIVTTTARPRDRFGYINAGGKVKRDLCAAEFTAHLAPILSTPEYAALATETRAAEEEEISIGRIANKGADARDIQLQMGARRTLVRLPHLSITDRSYHLSKRRGHGRASLEADRVGDVYGGRATGGGVED